MNKSILGLLLLLILMQSCKKDEIPTCENCNFTCIDANESNVLTNNCIENWECNFKVNSQSTIDIEAFNGKTDGNKNVFQIINSTEGSPDIADDEFTNILIFELEESQNSFSVQGSELENMQVHYKRVCFCPNVSFEPISSGCLQGEKQPDGTWFVQGKLVAPASVGGMEIKFDSQFVN